MKDVRLPSTPWSSLLDNNGRDMQHTRFFCRIKSIPAPITMTTSSYLKRAWWDGRI